MRPRLKIVKIGGALLKDQAALANFLGHFASLEGSKILVHGGGNAATDYERRLGMRPQLHNGRRITDAQSLEVVTMVYAGLLNKKVTAALQGLGCNALGVTGADGNVITAKKREVNEVDYGFAGDITAVNTSLITGWLKAGISPVCCPITHDGNGQLLNTNADTIAAELAVALSTDYHTALFYCFDKAGVLSDPEDEGSLVEVLNMGTYLKLKDEARISSGMLPKLKNCFYALERGVSEVKLGSFSMLVSNDEKKTEVIL